MAGSVYNLVTDNSTVVLVDDVVALVSADNDTTFSVLTTQQGTIANVKYVTFELSTGVEATHVGQVGVAIYPNTVTGQIRLANLQAGASIVLTNLNGQVMYRATASQAEGAIDVSAYAPGVYIVTVGGKSLKFIKK